ncbi:MAG: sigma-70 family RNA polymerase sigma factor [Chthoniobacterales bacterium]|nr:sigma-70 family RNA polymerase sigma factor [Chthoniobacterales bacterium]
MSAVDKQTFDRLMLSHLAAAMRFAIRLTGNVDAAEDVVQEALYRAARSWATFNGQAKFQTWLFRIVINATRDRAGKTAKTSNDEPLPETVIDAKATDPKRHAQSQEFGRIVASMIATLPPRQREVLVLSTYESLEIREIAETVGISEVNVRANLHLARERMREKLKPYLDERLSRG